MVSSDLTLAELARAGHARVLHELPRMNADLDRTGGLPGSIVAAWSPWFGALLRALLDGSEPLPRPLARKLVQLADFPIGSIERHAQRAGAEPGAAKLALAGVDVALIRLAGAGGLPAPRGGVATYWIENDEREPLLFTGTRGEALFGSAVRRIDRLQRHGAELLRPICTGELDVASAAAVEAMHEAARNASAVRETLLELWRRDETGERNLSVDVFTCQLRTYLAAYPVGGRLFHGPNAANIPGQIEHDFSIGTVDERYRSEIVPERLLQLDAEDCVRVCAVLAHRSTLERILDALGLTAQQATAATPAALAARLAASPGLEAVRAFVALARNAGSTWGTHQSQINTYLKRAAREVPAERLRSLPVPPTAGTGGHVHDSTERLMRMRHDHPVVHALALALRELDAKVRA